VFGQRLGITPALDDVPDSFLFPVVKGSDVLGYQCHVVRQPGDRDLNRLVEDLGLDVFPGFRCFLPVGVKPEEFSMGSSPETVRRKGQGVSSPEDDDTRVQGYQ
jgi:hypothetical protein